MDAIAGEGGLIPRLFLVAPDGAVDLMGCLEDACAAGDVASLLVSPRAAAELIALAQSKNVAVLTSAGVREGADGVQVEATTEAVTAARRAVGHDRIVGAFAGRSRHLAMEAGEAGANYVAFSQADASPAEPIIKWWSGLFEIPCVAFDPVGTTDLDILLPQKPDFIRPSDAMWKGRQSTRRIVTDLMQRLSQT